MIAAPLSIVEIDLRDLPSRLERPEGTNGACLVFFDDKRPLGRCLVAAGEFPLPSATIAALAARACAPAIGSSFAPDSFPAVLPDTGDSIATAARPLALANPSPSLEDLLRTGVSGSDISSLAAKASVVVCTRGRPKDLARCLAALARLETAPGEIVVVDNARAGEPKAEIPGGSGVRLVACPEGGLSAARNAGIRSARGSFVVFTDDDAQVHPSWLGALLAGFRSDRVGCVTGMVLPEELVSDAQVAFEFRYGGLAGGFRPLEFGPDFLALTRSRGTPVWRIGAGAAMAFRRAALDDVGPFDVRLGAGASGCSEDSEIWYRLLVRGWSCRYEPAAIVYHRHRRDWDGFARQMTSYMAGHVAALLVQYARHGDRGNLRRLAVSLPRHYARRVLGALAHGRGRDLRLLACEMRGCLRGLRPAYLSPKPLATGGEAQP